jgi:hypothetical protein
VSQQLKEYINKLVQNEVRALFAEGGWTSLKTQGTKLNPAVLKAADEFTKNLVSDFNKWLKTDSPDVPGLNPVRPVGSGIYYEEDIEEDPDKLYGDIDYLIEYPILPKFGDDKKKNEAASTKFYNQKLFQFFDATKPKGVDIEDSKGREGGTGVVIAEVQPDKFVQIDFVATHKEYTNWAKARFTPIRNIKGFVSGGVYAALAEALMFSIGDKGVRAKLAGGILVPYSKRKNTEEQVISLAIDSFFTDIVSFFSKLKGTAPQHQSEDIGGYDPENLTLESMAAGIRSLGVALERNGIFDGVTTQYRNRQEFNKAVTDRFGQKMQKVLDNPKFEKAANPEAEAAREKIFNFATTSRDKFQSLLS